MELHPGFRYSLKTSNDSVIEASVTSADCRIIRLQADSGQEISLLARSVVECKPLYADEFRDFSDKKRSQLAKSGAAMKDGSYPIVTEGDLHNAVQAIGRSKNPDATKAHIVKRAKALGKTNALPEEWSASTKNTTASAAPVPVRDRVRTVVASIRVGSTQTFNGDDVDGYRPQPYHRDSDETVCCPKCDCYNSDDAAYCDQCGHHLAGDDDVKS